MKAESTKCSREYFHLFFQSLQIWEFIVLDFIKMVIGDM